MISLADVNVSHHLSVENLSGPSGYNDEGFPFRESLRVSRAHPIEALERQSDHSFGSTSTDGRAVSS